MRVFLIPIGPDEYEPYYEPPDESDDDAPGADEGWFTRQRRRFRDMLREAEAERHRRHAHDAAEQPGVALRLRRKCMRWMVERAAEQRLLWHLRTATAATLAAPDDLPSAHGLAVLHRGLKRDADRHLRWCLLNGLGVVVTIGLTLLPGPNLVGYYFTFTTVGHFLAWRGARHGVRHVTWEVAPNVDLTMLRAALTMASPAREARVHEVAARLGLDHLATFFERLAVPAA